MKDANRRLFRSLEKVAGPGEFDTIVAAAVASYGALRQPSDAQARDFARLVVPVWEKLSAEARRALGAALSNSPRVPREVVDRLMAEPVETAAPFLVASPVLTDEDRAALARKRDGRFHRLAGPAPHPPAAQAPVVPPVAAPRTHPEPPAASPAAPPSRGEPARPPTSDVSSSPAARPVPGQAAAGVREALRRMVRPDGAASKAARRTIADLVALAVDRDLASAYDAIAEMTGVDAASGQRIEGDETGECLAVALKALGVGPADAMTVLMMLKPRIGLDTAAFDVMARYYRTLKQGDCALLLGTRRRLQAPALQPQFEDIETTERPAPRAAFGRRSTRPGMPNAKSRSA